MKAIDLYEPYHDYLGIVHELHLIDANHRPQQLHHLRCRPMLIDRLGTECGELSYTELSGLDVCQTGASAQQKTAATYSKRPQSYVCRGTDTSGICGGSCSERVSSDGPVYLTGRSGDGIRRQTGVEDRAWELSVGYSSIIEAECRGVDGVLPHGSCIEFEINSKGLLAVPR